MSKEIDTVVAAGAVVGGGALVAAELSHAYMGTAFGIHEAIAGAISGGGMEAVGNILANPNVVAGLGIMAIALILIVMGAKALKGGGAPGGH